MGVVEDIKVGAEGNKDKVGETVEVEIASKWGKRRPGSGGGVEEVRRDEGGIL